MIWVNWSDKCDVAFMRLKKNTVLGRPHHAPDKTQLSQVWEVLDGELILRPVHDPTISNPYGRDANDIISNDNYWLTEKELQELIEARLRQP
ncbi:MAG TPA: hypothetical protein VK211_24145 [Kamptonema sp.]|nr:hypothetical protein [Kamptonema sp.]